MTPNDNFLPARRSAAFSFIAFRPQNLADRVCRVALWIIFRSMTLGLNT